MFFVDSGRPPRRSLIKYTMPVQMLRESPFGRSGANEGMTYINFS